MVKEELLVWRQSLKLGLVYGSNDYVFLVMGSESWVIERVESNLKSD